MSHIRYTIKSFDALSKDELYDVLRLRSEVFVVEQTSIYQDVDNKDQLALHVMGVKDGKLICYARIFDKGIYFKEASIGRVVIRKEARSHGYGHKLLKLCITSIENYFSTKPIKISAQCYLESFYKSHGFVPHGTPYLEDGIPHIAMYRS